MEDQNRKYTIKEKKKDGNRGKAIQKEIRLANVPKRHEYITDPFIDEIILHRWHRHNKKKGLILEPIVTQYEVPRKINDDTVLINFKSDVKPDSKFGAGSPRIYDVVHCLLDMWRRDGCKNYLHVKPLGKIRDAINYTHTDTVVENVLSFVNYDIRITSAYDREKGVLFGIHALSPFKRAYIYIPKYKKLGGELIAEINPEYISYFGNNLVYLDFKVEEIFQQIPAEFTKARRAVFLLSKYHNLGVQKNNKEIVIDIRPGSMFHTVFELPTRPKQREEEIRRIFEPIKLLTDYITDYKYYPKKNIVICKKGHKSVKADEPKELDAPKEDTTESSKEESSIVMKGMYALNDIGFTQSRVKDYAKRLPHRCAVLPKVVKKAIDCGDLKIEKSPGAFIRYHLDNYELLSWEENSVLEFTNVKNDGNFDYRKDIDKAKQLINKVRGPIDEPYSDFTIKMNIKRWVIFSGEMVSNPYQSLSNRRLFEYVFGVDMVNEAMNTKMKYSDTFIERFKTDGALENKRLGNYLSALKRLKRSKEGLQTETNKRIRKELEHHIKQFEHTIENFEILCTQAGMEHLLKDGEIE